MTGAERGAVIDGLRLRPLDSTRDYEPIAELISTTNAADGLDWVMTVATLRHEVTPGGPGRAIRVGS